MRRLVLAALVTAVLALSTGCSSWPFDPNPRPDDGVGVDQQDDDREEPVTVDRGSADDASLSLTGDASSITLGTDAAAGDLLEVSATAPDSRPGAEQSDGTHVVALDGGAAIVRLAEDVAWDVDLAAGADTVDADLSATRVTGIVLDGGARSIELTLPRPDGDVPLEQRAGADQLVIHLPDGVGARVTVTSGAGGAQIDGESTQGIGSGTVLTTDGFDESDDHYEITVAGGLGNLTIDRV
ncbi:hypothetical protein [Cellulomonas xylanilytica]|uniref:Lipoprotein n=1 Tax=Cellulomonas xylanilytica TaxID=233583 RepID=A0A510V6H8_9CELL|nr:hypothetical protein [Cellulomonas xylanilytica]GEK22478.1 hypothetical protein CXY01_29980 [Cellulomonas xylanilytica]